MPHSDHGSKTKLFWILILSTAYMVLELVGGFLSGSLALIADAGHMAVDVAAIVLSLFAIWIAQKPPTQHKTYGFYRAEILAALINGALLVTISVWIFVEAWQRLGSPPKIEGALMTVIAAGGLIVNLAGLSLMHRGKNQNLNLRSIWLHLLSDALGSASACLAGFFVWRFEWTLADPIISIGIGLLILHGSWKLLSETVNVLLEGVPKGISLPEIRREIESLSGIDDVHDLHVWTVTSGVHALSAHVRLRDHVDHSMMLGRITTLLETKYNIAHVTLQLEPPAYSHQELHF